MRNLNIEGLRGVLILWIILFHYTTRYSELFNVSVSWEFENGGVVGVALFFAISGFFLGKSLLEEEKVGLKQALKFSINKYWRLYTPYVISVIIIYIITDLLFPLQGRECDTKSFVVNLFLIYHPFVGFVDGAHWFIADLIKIQISLSLLYLFRKSENRKVLIWVASVVLLTFVVANYYSDGNLFTKIYRFIGVKSFLSVLLGINLYLSFAKSNFYSIIISALIAIYLSLAIHIVLIPLCLFFFYCFISKNRVDFWLGKYGIFNNRVLLFLGSVSFQWYLVHQNIGFLILNHLGFPIGLIVALGVTLSCAICVKYFVHILPNKIY